jgi:hypothetical protein
MEHRFDGSYCWIPTEEPDRWLICDDRGHYPPVFLSTPWGRMRLGSDGGRFVDLAPGWTEPAELSVEPWDDSGGTR